MLLDDEQVVRACSSSSSSRWSEDSRSEDSEWPGEDPEERPGEDPEERWGEDPAGTGSEDSEIISVGAYMKANLVRKLTSSLLGVVRGMIYEAMDLGAIINKQEDRPRTHIILNRRSLYD